MENIIYPADKLLGVELPDDWVVESKIKRKSNVECVYSTCYIVRKGNKKGFLKAFDYRDLRKPGGTDKFNVLNNKYRRERDLIKKCSTKGIKGVVELITHNQYYFKEGDSNELVDYFILEYSENGNVQDCLENDNLIDLELKFESLVHVFDGLSDLHTNGIMHLDLKPTNLIYFVEERLTKITDFGSARQWMGSLDDDLKDDENRIRTTRSYSPPEFLYKEPPIDWIKYRKKIDLYLVGNIIVTFFTNFSFTALLRKEITSFDDWNDSLNDGRFKEILPNLIKASTEVFKIIEKKIIITNKECKSPLYPEDINLIMLMIRQLCNPNPDERGDPKELIRITKDDGLYRMRDRFVTLQKRVRIRTKKIYKEGII